jgi:hypothetical protein
MHVLFFKIAIDFFFLIWMECKMNFVQDQSRHGDSAVTSCPDVHTSNVKPDQSTN